MAEDRETRRALEELEKLAELFLSDASVKGDRPQSEASDAPASAHVAELASTAPGENSAEVIADELVGPEPVRLAPKPSPTVASPADSADSEPEPERQRAGEPTKAQEDPATPARDAAPPLRLHRAGSTVGEVGAEPADPIDAAVRSAIERGQGPVTATAPGSETAGGHQAGVAEVDRPRADARPAQLHAEAVLMGNLPGFSGPWLTQYGQLLAQHLGPVVMLHVDDEWIDAELIEPTDRPQVAGRVSPGEVPPAAGNGAGAEPGPATAMDAGRPDLIARLESLMQPGSAQVRAILVHGEASARPAALERLKALECWTLLCGADDAAVSAGQQLVASLAEADGAVRQQRLRMMVVGSGEAAARAAVERLAGATRSLLDEPVTLAGIQRRMVPVNLRQLGRFGPTGELWPRLTAWLGQFEAAPPPAGPMTVSEREAAVSPPDSDPDAEAPDPADLGGAASSAAGKAEVGVGETTDADWAWLRDAGTAAASAESPAEPASAKQSQASVEQSQAGTAQSRAEPQAGPQAVGEKPAPSSAPHPPDADDLDLAQFLTTGDGQIAGGIALEARCPDQPRTQLLLDQRGRLHLLRRHTSESSGGEAPESLRSAVVDLLGARRWVLQHIELLALTQRQCRFDTAAEPTLHLFTDRADLATGLIARLGDTLRVHLLKQVRVGAQSTWFCTPMQGEEV